MLPFLNKLFSFYKSRALLLLALQLKLLESTPVPFQTASSMFFLTGKAQIPTSAISTWVGICYCFRNWHASQAALLTGHPLCCCSSDTIPDCQHLEDPSLPVLPSLVTVSLTCTEKGRQDKTVLHYSAETMVITSGLPFIYKFLLYLVIIPFS